MYNIWFIYHIPLENIIAEKGQDSDTLSIGKYMEREL